MQGRLHATLQDRPAWIVTFIGPGIKIPSLGRSRAVHNELNVVIDAGTGQYLDGFTG